MAQSHRDSKRELEKTTARMQKLDAIIQRLYEDNLDGKISDDRFAKMSASYEQEQAELKTRFVELGLKLKMQKPNRMGWTAS